MICCICDGEIDPVRNELGTIVWTEGHNAEPVVANGRCCDSCNWGVVIPARLGVPLAEKLRDSNLT